MYFVTHIIVAYIISVLTPNTHTQTLISTFLTNSYFAFVSLVWFTVIGPCVAPSCWIFTKIWTNLIIIFPSILICKKCVFHQFLKPFFFLLSFSLLTETQLQSICYSQLCCRGQTQKTRTWAATGQSVEWSGAEDNRDIAKTQLAGGQCIYTRQLMTCVFFIKISRLQGKKSYSSI